MEQEAERVDRPDNVVPLNDVFVGADPPPRSAGRRQKRQFRRRHSGSALSLLRLPGPSHRILFGKHAIGE
jgi:hypothetical protein